MSRLFKQFSFPGGIPSHVAPETPGSIHEGGEFGYSTARLASSATCELCKNSLTCTRRLQRAEKHRHRHKKSSLRGCQMKASRNRGAKALINPHAAKQIAKDTVPRASCKLAPRSGWDRAHLFAPQ